MKKRFVALVASACVLALMPSVASAESVTELRILGTDMLSAQGSLTCGEGAASYDATTNTLTLDNATIDAGSGDGIRFTGPLNIELTGANKITSSRRGIYGNGVEKGSVAIAGDEGASLVVESGSDALQVDDTTAPAVLSIDDVVLSLTSTEHSGIVLEGLSLEVGGGAQVSLTSAGTSVKTDQSIFLFEESSLTADGSGAYGLVAEKDLSVTDATLSASSMSVAVNVDGDIDISDATVTTESKPNSLRSSYGTISVTGDSVVTARGGVFGERGVSIEPVAGEKVDLWTGASEAEATHYASADGTQRSPFASAVTLNSYHGLSKAAYVRILRHVHSGDPATCTARAVCEYCGEEYGELDLSNHVWGEPTWQWYEGGSVCAAAFSCKNDGTHLKVMYAEVSSAAGKAPTCTEKGTTVYTAELTFEGTSYTTTTELADVDVLPHTPEVKGARDATCTSEGFTGDEVCSVCGALVEEGTATPKLAHTPKTMGAKDATCSSEGYTGDEVCSVCDALVEKGKATPKLAHTPKLVGAEEATTSSVGYTGDVVCSVCDELIQRGEVIPALPVGVEAMYRLYNRWTGEHFYTGSAEERDVLVTVGWTPEGIGWYAPTEGAEVYRLYNPYSETGDHHYTMSAEEYDALGGLGWEQEGVCWHSADELDDNVVAILRQFNPYVQTGTHNYTTSREENDALVELGWRHEGIAWYGVEAPEGK